MNAFYASTEQRDRPEWRSRGECGSKKRAIFAPISSKARLERYVEAPTKIIEALTSLAPDV